MQKAIYIENTGKRVERVLSVADPSIIETNPTGLEYTLIDDYTEPPVVANPSLDINYPMYDTANKKFMWVTVNYMYTATDQILDIQNLKAQNAELQKTINIMLTGEGV